MTTFTVSCLTRAASSGSEIAPSIVETGVHVGYSELGLDDLRAHRRENPLKVRERGGSTSGAGARAERGNWLVLED